VGSLQLADPEKANYPLFLKRANVLYQRFNLIFGKFVLERGHPVPASADNGEEFFVRLFLDFIGRKRSQLQVLAEHCVARSVCTVTGRAFRLISIKCALRKSIS
jgi:hypothetical protein